MTYISAICKAYVQGSFCLSHESHDVTAVFRQVCSSCLADSAPDGAPADHEDKLCLRF